MDATKDKMLKEALDLYELKIQESQAWAADVTKNIVFVDDGSSETEGALWEEAQEKARAMIGFTLKAHSELLAKGMDCLKRAREDGKYGISAYNQKLMVFFLEAWYTLENIVCSTCVDPREAVKRGIIADDDSIRLRTSPSKYKN